MVVRKRGSPGYFFIANAPETGKQYIYQSLCRFILYLLEDKRGLRDVIKLKPVTLPSDCALVGACYVQHAELDTMGTIISSSIYI